VEGECELRAGPGAEPMSSTPPWWDDAWRYLQRRRESGRLPHAVLLAGPQGIGKGAFAEEWARALLCETPVAGGRACGRCRACRLSAAGTHPDRFRLDPVEGRAIPIDAVRALCGFLTLSGNYGGWRVALIVGAERMTIAAANALLKTLEEPGARTMLLLVSDRAGMLPATVRSRCQRIVFPLPPRAAALAWLNANAGGEEVDGALARAGGAPFAALEWIRSGAEDPRPELVRELAAVAGGRTDPAAAAQRCAARGAGETLRWLSSCVMDMVRLRCSSQPAVLRHPDLREPLQRLAAACPPQRLFRYLDRLGAGEREAAGSMNDQLLLEDVFIEWRELSAPLRRGRG